MVNIERPTPKEKIYDEQINPLMAQIIGICKEHKIAVVASFALAREDDEDKEGNIGLMCTTALTTEEFEPPQALRDCVKRLYQHKPAFCAITITGPLA